MKMITQERTVKSSDGLEITEFDIEKNAKAFKILSSNIYSDKYAALIRELSCNAYDSHIEAGKQDVPFEVHIPTDREPWLHVRDFGIGLDEEQVRGLYSTYFKSTKADSNDFTGAMGLGSKSPFAYTDQFTVTAIKDGMKKTFLVFLSETSTPALTKISEEPTSDCNGVTVRVEVKTGYYESRYFEQAARKTLCWFDKIPTITGPHNFSVESAVVEKFVDYFGDEHDDWFIDRNMNGIYALQGNVLYPIKKDICRDGFDTAIFSNLRGLVLKFPIGSVDFAASREELSYDKRTTANLYLMLDAMRDHYEDRMEKHLKTFKTAWEASVSLYSTRDPLVSMLYDKDEEYEIAGKKISRYYYPRKGNGDHKIKAFSMYRTNGEWVGGVSPEKGSKIFYKDVKNHFVYSARKYCDDHNCKTYLIYTDDPKILREMKEDFGDAEILPISSVLQTPPKRMTVPKSKFRVLDGYSFKINKPQFNPSDDTGVRLYMEQRAGTILNKNGDKMTLGDLKEMLKMSLHGSEMKIDMGEIIFMTPATAKKLAGKDGWTHVEDFADMMLKKQFEDMSDTISMYEAFNKNRIYHWQEPEFIQNMKEINKRIDLKKVGKRLNPDIEKMVLKVEEYSNFYNNHNHRYRYLMDRKLVDIDNDKIADEVKFIHQFKKKYPILLALGDNDFKDRNLVDDLKFYIEAKSV